MKVHVHAKSITSFPSLSAFMATIHVRCTAKKNMEMIIACMYSGTSNKRLLRILYKKPLY